jgi:hypothetical protein
MTDNQQQVALFLTLAGKKAPEQVQMVSKEFFSFWYNFMLEELEETREAYEQDNIVKVIDGTVDLDWALNNLTHMMGLLQSKVYQKAFDEVDRANFSKFCKTEEEAIESVKNYSERTDDKQCEAYYKQVGNFWIVFRKSDNKILKAKSFSEPNIKSILENETN